MNSINNSNLNFTAKMDVSGIRFNKARWQKISPIRKFIFTIALQAVIAQEQLIFM